MARLVKKLRGLGGLLILAMTAAAAMLWPGWVAGDSALTPTVFESPLNTSPLTHTVAPGEVLSDIAMDYALPLTEVLQANPALEADHLQVGQVLEIPLEAETSLPVTGRVVTYTVEAGDTPLAISARFDVPLAQLMAVNAIVDPTSLQIGQVLTVPDTVRSDLPSTLIPYQVQAGDTLLALALRFEIPLAALEAANPGVDPTRLQIDQTLHIPAGVETDGTSPPAAPATVEPVAPITTETDLAAAMFEAINTHRVAKGLAPYQHNPALTEAAAAHAADMITRGYFAHQTPEGISLQDRLTARGIGFSWSGENIQRNVRPRAETVDWALNWFMNSDPHRRNILHAHYTDLGVAVLEGPPGWYTVVLNFVAP